MIQFFRHTSQKDLFIFYITNELGIDEAKSTILFRDTYFVGEKNKIFVIMAKDSHLTEKEALNIIADQDKKQEHILSFIYISGLIGIQKMLYKIYITLACTSFERKVFNSISEFENFLDVNVFQDFEEITV